jgi:hypothetical protein
VCVYLRSFERCGVGEGVLSVVGRMEERWGCYASLIIININKFYGSL